MKKTMLFVMFVAGCGMLAGCLTKATAYTVKTLPDGTVTESHVTIIGTGDKASKMAAEGLFADGTEEDLGAGVKNASASQQSTGIDGTLAGLGNVITGLAALQAAMRPVAGPVSASVASDGESALAVGAGSAPVIASGSTVAASAPRSVASYDKGITVAIVGNRATCSYCRTLWSQLDPEALSKTLGGVSVIDADLTDNPSEYAAKRPATAFQYPLVRVFDADGKLIGEFVARAYTQEKLASKVREFAPALTEK